MRFRRHWRVLPPIALVAALAAAGCGSDSKTAALPPAGQSAQDHVQTLVASSQSTDLAREAEYFADYHSQYPSDGAGTLGHAITRVALALNTLATKYGVDWGQIADATGLRSAARAARGSAGGPMRGLVALTTGRGPVPLLPGGTRVDYPPSEVAADIRTILNPELKAAIAELGPLVSMSGVLASVMDDGQTVHIRAEEARAVRAAMESLLAVTATVVAYSWSSGSFDWNQTPTALDANSDGVLTPQEYLPGGILLTLVDRRSLDDAWTAMGGALGDAKAVAQSMSASSDPQQLLAADAASADWAQTEVAIRGLQQALQGPTVVPLEFPVPGSSATLSLPITVDFRAFWADPPSDLKLLMPTFRYRVTQAGLELQVIQTDKTLGGLLPNGATEIPAALWSQPFTVPQ